MNKERQFPIMLPLRGTKGPCPQSIPWVAIENCEAQAQINHRQSIEKLASRGGLSPIEAYFVITGRNWDNFVLTDELDREASAFLTKLVQDRDELFVQKEEAVREATESRATIARLEARINELMNERMDRPNAWCPKDGLVPKAWITDLYDTGDSMPKKTCSYCRTVFEVCRCPNYLSVVDGKCGACGKLVPNGVRDA